MPTGQIIHVDVAVPDEYHVGFAEYPLDYRQDPRGRGAAHRAASIDEFRRLFDALLLAVNLTSPLPRCWPGHDGDDTSFSPNSVISITTSGAETQRDDRLTELPSEHLPHNRDRPATALPVQSGGPANPRKLSS
jgi:hypothetical protein